MSILTERQRELATLKVLGFYDTEVSAYVYRENVILTLIGVLAGAVFRNLFAQVLLSVLWKWMRLCSEEY